MVRDAAAAIDRNRDGAGRKNLGDQIIAEVIQRASVDLLSAPGEVVNATGTILHTNLGRAPLSDAAVAAMVAVSGYTDLDYDLGSGRRRSRQVQVEPLINALIGAEGSLMVANNAAALLVALAATPARKEIVVSRGQAVEIGGGFRLPEIVAQSGARLVEVGTTNRTTIDDYVEAITPRTAAFLHVHTSNFRIVGYHAAVDIADLAGAAHERGLLCIVDNGSGALVATERFGLRHEPMPAEALAAGADIVTFSTDKLLGGPQGGIVAGREAVIARVSKHPLTRTVRADKCGLAGLRATLQSYVSGAEKDIPVLAMLGADLDVLRERANRLAAAISGQAWIVDVTDGESTVGGGSLPDETMPTVLLTITAPSGAEMLARSLRQLGPPIIARIHESKVLLDPRTILARQDRVVAAALCLLTTRDRA